MNELFARLTENLVANEPPSKGLRFAAVAMVVRDRNSPSVLFIKRVERAGDPWSGQVAFPGGKTQPEDRTPRDTAVRETLEEVGFDLDETAQFLGYGAVTRTHTGTMDVVPAVFELKGGVEITPNEEVASYRWVDLQDLLSPASQSTFEFKSQERVVRMPAYVTGDYVVWGLTQRILGQMLQGPE